MHKFRLSVGAAALLVAFNAAPAHAFTQYDALADFSTASNPNGVWSYLYNGLSALPTATTFGANPQLQSWWDGQTVPNSVNIIANTSGTDIQSGTVVFSANALLIDPQSLGATVQFTAPTAGTYNLTGFFSSLDTTGNSHAANIYVGGTLVDSYTIADYASAASNFNFNVTLTSGETVDFTVATGGGACSYCFLSTGFDATITPVVATPEPASAAIFGGALLALNGLRRRLRRR
jgi:hypothetical protein